MICSFSDVWNLHVPIFHRIELEKTLQQCINEKEDYKEKYEQCNRKYEDIKSQLEKSLRTAKTLKRQLQISEENASSLYRRYAIESDLNKRLTQRTTAISGKEETWKFTGNASNDICERLDDFEGRLLQLELILTDASDLYNMS